MSDLSGKTCLITGATDGIGLETARLLAEMGARIIGLGRNPEKCHLVRENLRSQTGNGLIDFQVVDSSNLTAVADFADHLIAQENKLDILLNNAGTFTSRYSGTPTGTELQFTVNFLSHFLLTLKLLPLLEKAANGRVISVSSNSHRSGKMHWADLNLERHYFGLTAYSQSKLATVLFTYELQRRLGENSRVSTYAVDPGLVNTRMGFKQTGPLTRLVWGMRRHLGTSPVTGAETSVFTASEPVAAERGGLYWEKCRPVRSSKNSYDQAAARKLWAISKRLCASYLIADKAESL